MSIEECISILEKMQFCEHTDFAHDITFGFGNSKEWMALDKAVEILKELKEQKNDNR